MIITYSCYDYYILLFQFRDFPTFFREIDNHANDGIGKPVEQGVVGR